MSENTDSKTGAAPQPAASGTDDRGRIAVACACGKVRGSAVVFISDGTQPGLAYAVTGLFCVGKGLISCYTCGDKVVALNERPK